jgi:hypothetical protein
MKAPENESPLYFRQVLEAELREVVRGRRVRCDGEEPATAEAPEKPAPPPTDPQGAYRQAHESRLVGLAFSGGGIRSATFNLGVLQALSELGLLRIFDYLSTVSGGGYVGAWLTSALKRARRTFAELDEALNPAPSDRRGPREDQRIRFLRSYSNYLTPRAGLLSQDTWAVVTIYLRNFLLNLSILITALSALLLLPRLALWASLFFHGLWPLGGGAVATSGIALYFIWRSLNALPLGPGKSYSRYSQPGWIFVTVLLPTLASALCGAGFLWRSLAEPDGSSLYLLDGLRLGPGRTLPWWAISAALYTLSSLPAFAPKSWKHRGVFLLATLVAGAAGGAMLQAMLHYLALLRGGAGEGAPDPTGVVIGLSFAPPLFLLIYVLAGMLHLGIEGRSMSDERREWLSRLGGRLLQIALAWCGFFLIALWSPVLAARVGGWAKLALGSGWLASTALGVLAGRGSRTQGEKASPLLDRVARITPPIFAVGLLVLLAVVLDRLLRWRLHIGWGLESTASWTLNFLRQARAVHQGLLEPGPMLWTALITAALALLLSWRIDINEFSMHLFYRNRLIRCYLGASNAGRRQNPFTGFDPDDDLPLASLRLDSGYHGPLPIINTAINLVHGEELAWQERKAASFTFTPLHAGYDMARVDADRKDEAGEGSYRPTSSYAYPNGISLGTAVAVSGAAASPNMGYHSSPALAFLMTVFNVRLGWWLGNPAHARTWRRPGPPVGILYLLSELLGLTHARSSYVYLSDGGHFENLGVYELVKRRCRLIVACDAGQDAAPSFSDLGNAIRKCRNDLGIDIEIDTTPLDPKGPERLSTWHCAVGRIRYDRVDPGAAAGTLVYLKPTLTGDEPTDLLNYRSLHPEFPHQSTGDQFFAESQFESYRKLGYHVGSAVFEEVAAVSRREAFTAFEPFVESLIAELKQRWFPPSAAVAIHFSRHAAALDHLVERLRKDEALRFLDDQIYPEWRNLLAAGGQAGPEPPPPELWLPSSPAEIRQGFYFSVSLLQMMESVYVDLKLDADADHPDNRGWLNLFKHWSWSGMVRVTWAIAAGTFGLRFQRFCERRLGLELGKVKVSRLGIGSRGPLAEALAAEVALRHLNLFEERLIRELPHQSGQPFDDIAVFELEVARPVRLDGEDFRFAYGFALLQDGELLYLRIQDHLRTMGLARGALKALIAELGVDGFVEPGAWFAVYQAAAPEALRVDDVERCRRLFLSELLQVRGYRQPPACEP